MRDHSTSIDMAVDVMVVVVLVVFVPAAVVTLVEVVVVVVTDPSCSGPHATSKIANAIRFMLNRTAANVAFARLGRMRVAFGCAVLLACGNVPSGDGSGGTRVFVDDFEGSEDWLVDEDFDRRYYYAGGRYWIEANSGGWTAFAPYEGNIATPYGVSTEVTVIVPSAGANASASLLIERIDADNLTLFFVDADGWYKVTEIRGGVSRDLRDWTSTSRLFPAGTPNVIRVNRYADRIEIFANGDGLRTLRTDALSGDVRVGVGSTTFRGMGTSSAAFERFEIFDLAVAM